MSLTTNSGVPSPYTRESALLSEREFERLGQLHPTLRKMARRWAELHEAYPARMHAGFRALQAMGYVAVDPETPWPGLPDEPWARMLRPLTPTYWEYIRERADGDTVASTTEHVWLLPFDELQDGDLAAFQAFATQHGWTLGVLPFSIDRYRPLSMTFTLPPRRARRRRARGEVRSELAQRHAPASCDAAAHCESQARARGRAPHQDGDGPRVRGQRAEAPQDHADDAEDGMSAPTAPVSGTHARPPASPGTPWLTLSEVAARWKVSVGYVREQARAGRLRTTLVGRHHRVHVTWADQALGYHANDIGTAEGQPS